ncbi:MAG: winged helix-turn-helix domain-containing protein [Ideonella sp.]|nr:winged helix-turn-helix domain-containing protein [Ideonella sp.]MCC7455390.1 winged helix-turn-helix domain-containing protein [Nitrospira sp.]
MSSAATVAPIEPTLRFGRFELSAAERALRVDGRPAAVGARAFDLLLALAQRRERMVTQQELLDLVWPGVVVEPHNITAQISSLRKLLGPGVIATVPGRGYQFVASSTAPPAAAPVVAAPAAPSRHNLPPQRTRFIGRSAEMDDLARLLPQTRLLTLTGIGGCGKTRLALQAAQQCLADFTDGVWFVDLAPIADADRVAPACAAVLGLEPEPSALPLADRLAAQLASRRALIVLDNCEHVREGAAALGHALLGQAGSTRILATSREPLAVAGEQLFPVRSLSLPTTTLLDDVRASDAVRVFIDRARLVQPEFDADAGNAAALAEICRRLDGIALAIELAAARVTVLSVPDIAARLQDRFRLLIGGHATVARQQTLLATMQWSHDLLDPAAQHALRRLAVFAAGCTLEAATAVAQAGDEYEALALLTQLHDKSLLVVERGSSRGGARPRYRMLETVRQYAQQRLDDSGEADAASARHAEHFLGLAEAAAPHLRGPQQSTWMARLHDERENLVAAMAWCTRQPATSTGSTWELRLAAASARYWLFHEVELGCRLVLGALQRAGADADPRVRFQALHTLAAMYMHRGLGDAGLPHAQQALAIAEQLGVAEWQAMALSSIGTCTARADQEDVALHYYQRARDAAQASGSALPLATACNNIAAIQYRRGHVEPAIAGFRQSLALSRATGDIRMALITLHNLVRVLVAARDHEAAREAAIEAELLLRGVEEPVLKLELIEVVAGLASSRGEHALAARWWGATLQRYADLGYHRPPEDETQLQQLRAQTRQALGDAECDAATVAGSALEIERATAELKHWLERHPRPD